MWLGVGDLSKTVKIVRRRVVPFPLFEKNPPPRVPKKGPGGDVSDSCGCGARGVDFMMKDDFRRRVVSGCARGRLGVSDEGAVPGRALRGASLQRLRPRRPSDLRCGLFIFQFRWRKKLQETGLEEFPGQKFRRLSGVWGCN